MEPKEYVIFNVSELDKIDFTQVEETSIETVRKSVDETLTFVKNVEILKQCKRVIGLNSAQMTKIAGSINSFLKNENCLFLIDPEKNELDVMGSSVQTS